MTYEFLRVASETVNTSSNVTREFEQEIWNKVSNRWERGRGRKHIASEISGAKYITWFRITYVSSQRCLCNLICIRHAAAAANFSSATYCATSVTVEGLKTHRHAYKAPTRPLDAGDNARNSQNNLEIVRSTGQQIHK